MPLSENEQQVLQIEEDLSATDPKLVQQVTDTTLYRHRARLIKWSAVGFVAGLLLMVFTFTTTLVLGVVGFVVMLGCRARHRAERAQARPGRARESHRLDAQRRSEEDAR